MSNRFLDLPGFAQAIDINAIESPIILLVGSANTGKTLYCRQFLLDGLALGSHCIFVSSDMTEKQIRAQVSGANRSMSGSLKFLSMRKIVANNSDQWRSIFSEEPPKGQGIIQHEDKTMANGEIQSGLPPDSKSLLYLLEHIRKLLADLQELRKDAKQVDLRVVIDSLSYLQQLFGERIIQKFVAALSTILKDANATALFVLSAASGTDSHETEFVNMLVSLTDGVIEIAVPDVSTPSSRRVRLAGIRGQPNSSVWIQYNIDETGLVSFEKIDDPAALNCTLCGKAIKGKPILYLDNGFDTMSCLDTYRKLSKFYGAGITPSTGMSSEIAELHFFFIDIVGLSDPLLSVKRQMDKITTLNNLIRSCLAFKITPKDKKIVLPTGDGMAIGFLANAELPLQLSIQLHKLLRVHNASKKAEDKLGIRIGISSGHVFLHNDINENQNVWGPGIILARRVMDLGDNLHILVEGDMAKSLKALKDEYMDCIRELCDYKIKHGQTIKIFTAYAADFGNSEMPLKLRQTM